MKLNIARIKELGHTICNGKGIIELKKYIYLKLIVKYPLLILEDQLVF